MTTPGLQAGQAQGRGYWVYRLLRHKHDPAHLLRPMREASCVSRSCPLRWDSLARMSNRAHDHLVHKVNRTMRKAPPVLRSVQWRALPQKGQAWRKDEEVGYESRLEE